MNVQYARWAILNSNGQFINHDGEDYYYVPFEDAMLFRTENFAKTYLDEMRAQFRQGEEINPYSDVAYDQKMKVVEVAVHLALKN